MSGQVDMFPANLVMVPADHETAQEDLKPTQRTAGGVNLSVTRVVVMNNRVWVVKDSPSGPVVAFAEDINPLTLYSNRAGGYLTTSSGKKMAWSKDESCGCGSRLRSWRPYRHVNSVADPTE